ncbi:SH3 domain-containing protein [Sinisalibacter aestuarii]|uniref:SH3b domain-containing protein n=1 Tax=Sinisalibacter aestuarii TaxID=2949426 RepID=A0ABQ5LZ51_9RHOB|nr:SH3 domain-containing protein [Sinisalibacter aestuarii]GKY90254.1 hypothetical protein STA1M1_41230 [Sinisalibacter aestuarii]
MFARPPILTVLATCLALAAPAQGIAQAIQTEHVAFAAGTTGTSLQGAITGDQIVDYVLTASAGQTMSVDMTTSNASSYFNVMKAGDPAAIYVGSINGLHFEDVLPSDGDWVIRVYLMRNAARRNETADYTIAVNIDGGGGGGGAAVVAATDPESVCLAAVSDMANTGDVAVVSSDFSEAGTMVQLAVGPDRAPWQCIAYEDGSTSGVMFLGDDSAGTAAVIPAPDYADGEAGGPDWWQVSVNGSLNVRSGPGTGYAAVGKAANGQLLRNLGCEGQGDGRWCHVEVDDGAYRGWVAGRFLREGAMPAAAGTGTTLPSASPLGPDLYIRPSGEIEASWASGCTVLYNPAGVRINAGASCSEVQLVTSDFAAAEAAK